MSRPARRVYNFKLQNGVVRILGVVGYGLGENRFECRFDQFVNEGGRSVIGPRQFSLGTFCFPTIFISGKPKGPWGGINVHFGTKLQ